MSPENLALHINVLDVSQSNYAERVCAAALQGLVNREGPRFFLDYGIYDERSARRTNEDFMDDEMWYGKYRELLGPQDERNLAYYQKEHGVEPHLLADLDAAIEAFRGLLHGVVVWDAGMLDTVNVALMMAAQENLLVVEAGDLARAQRHGLEIVHDLRGRWTDRLALYTWAFDEYFSRCEPGRIACIEPDWQRPEFLDYVVQQKIFTYSLSSKQEGLGGTLLLLLSFGPAWLRELLFALHLEGPIRRLAVDWLGKHSPEIRLNNRIQKAVKSDLYPTVFGWHTRRDDEMTFMLLLSANGLRLVPAHLASNFSFHSQMKPLGLKPHAPRETPTLDPEGIYLTFTLSDGDQLMMMSTAELGSWYSSHRGEVPFNWECQPLLMEIAPALLEKFQNSVTANDCLVAGPSGAGYIVPPLAPHLPAYMSETLRLCEKAGINVVTTYVPDPPKSVQHKLAHQSQGKINFMAGYAILGRAPMNQVENTLIVANQIPTLEQIWYPAEKLMSCVAELIDKNIPGPRFIGVHLFAYRTAYDDIVHFAEKMKNPHVHIVCADTFLELARVCSKKS